MTRETWRTDPRASDPPEDPWDPQRAALLQTLHTVNNGTKYCLACGTPRPAAQYKCACGKVATRRRG